MRGSIKVGLGILANKVEERIDETLEAFCQNPEVAAKLEGGELVRSEGHTIPMAGPHTNLAANRVLLAGDAGGFVYPGTGEGIFYAIKSGRIAAEVLSQSLEPGNVDKASLESEYSQALDRNGLLRLRDVNFVERTLSCSEKAEDYVRGLKRMLPK
jgi:flavin-dependent dehydrogenase